MTLAELLEGSAVLSAEGRTDVAVTGIALDSRRVRPGDAFFALAGARADGARFAAAAVAAGAVAVVGAADLAPAGVPTVRVNEPRLALARAAARFHGDPSRALAVAGVTGTNGKTTTTWLLEAAFRAAGRRAGVIGTTGIRVDGMARPSAFTTPEAPDLQALLADMRARGVEAVAMEVSSHALVQRRAWGVAFAAVAFTNLTQDHLDFHGTMDAYLDAKLMLFDGRNGPAAAGATAAINADDAVAPRVAAAARAGGLRVVRFGEAPDADVRVTSVAPAARGLGVTLADRDGVHAIALPLLGRYNAWNAACAWSVARALGLAPGAVARGLEACAGVPGRLERVDEGQPFLVVVDYAHTPDALARSLAACREHAGGGRVRLVFGCGGDRDRGKRPQMGAIAARLADRAWVTNDNPRTEDPAAIAAGIVAGAPHGALAVVLDRGRAIAEAIRSAGPGDVVLIAGKGHETTQTIGDRVLPFDDREVARAALAEGRR